MTYLLNVVLWALINIWLPFRFMGNGAGVYLVFDSTASLINCGVVLIGDRLQQHLLVSDHLISGTAQCSPVRNKEETFLAITKTPQHLQSVQTGLQ